MSQIIKIINLIIVPSIKMEKDIIHMKLIHKKGPRHSLKKIGRISKLLIHFIGPIKNSKKLKEVKIFTLMQLYLQLSHLKELKRLLNSVEKLTAIHVQLNNPKLVLHVEGRVKYFIEKINKKSVVLIVMGLDIKFNVKPVKEVDLFTRTYNKKFILKKEPMIKVFYE